MGTENAFQNACTGWGNKQSRSNKQSKQRGGWREQEDLMNETKMHGGKDPWKNSQPGSATSQGGQAEINRSE